MDLVKTAAWPLYRFNPDLIEQCKNPLIMDSGQAGDIMNLNDFLKTERRFGAARSVNKNFDKLVDKAQRANLYRQELKKHIAQFALENAESAKDDE